MSEINENPAPTVISNPSDRKKLRGMLEEIVQTFRKMEDQKIQKKMILDEIKRQFGISPGHAGGLARAMYKDNYDEIRASQEDFETLYETIVKSPNMAAAEAGTDKAQFGEVDVAAILAKFNDDDVDMEE